jgi:tripartite-type tricarboxylate transporter receptor subunit TctC
MTRRSAIVGAVALGLMAAGPAEAGPFPEKPIRVIVPFAAGGSTDVIARVIGSKLAARLGQPVIVDNRLGAGGNIGALAAARAAPDGYTLLLSGPASLSVSRLTKDIQFKYPDDFVPIGMAVSSAYVVLVNPSCR